MLFLLSSYTQKKMRAVQKKFLNDFLFLKQKTTLSLSLSFAPSLLHRHHHLFSFLLPLRRRPKARMARRTPPRDQNIHLVGPLVRVNRLHVPKGFGNQEIRQDTITSQQLAAERADLAPAERVPCFSHRRVLVRHSPLFR